MRIALIAGGRTAEGPGTLGSAARLSTSAAKLGWAATTLQMPEASEGRARLRVVDQAANSDVVIPLVSGLEGALHLVGVPYVGSAPAAAAIAAHKGVFNDLLTQAGLKSIAYAYGQDRRVLEETALASLELPVFVKPARLGASYGISRVSLRRDLQRAIDDAGTHDPVVLVEESIRPPFYEVEVAMVIGSAIRTADPALIRLPSSSVWHDTRSKYSNDTGIERVDDQEIRETAVHSAQKAVELAGVTGACRVDLFVDAGGNVTVGEINALPGHGAASTFPRIFELSGVSRSEQLALMVNAALELGRKGVGDRYTA